MSQSDPIKIPTDPIKIPTNPIKIPTDPIKIPTNPIKIPTEACQNPYSKFKIPTITIRSKIGQSKSLLVGILIDQLVDCHNPYKSAIKGRSLKISVTVR